MKHIAKQEAEQIALRMESTRRFLISQQESAKLHQGEILVNWKGGYYKTSDMPNKLVIEELF